MDRSSRVLVVPFLLTLDLIAAVVVFSTSLSKWFTSDVSIGIFVVALFIADLLAWELFIHRENRPILSYDSVVPSRIELTFNVNGKPVKKSLNIISVKINNTGRRAALFPAVVIDGVNLAREGAHVMFNFSREFHHLTFLPIQTITTSPSERELAYLVYQAAKPVNSIEGGDQGDFMVAFEFVPRTDEERTSIYLPSEAVGEPYPLLWNESWYIELLGQHKSSRIRPVSKERFVLRSSRWNEPELKPTKMSLEQAFSDFRKSRYAEAEEQKGAEVPAQRSRWHLPFRKKSAPPTV